ncbi:MAG: TetR family transcriptional regulator [Desulforhopalus sp.]|nr:TetR family transcriptional regulator [Desulforhopalus sp.]
MQNSNKRLPANERREVIIETVLQLAGLHNPSEITTYAIATQMQLSQGALFRHFATKDAIWQAVMESVSDRLLSQINHVSKTTEEPLAALRAIFMTHLEFAIDRPGIPRILFGELQKADATAAKQIAQTMLKQYALLIGTRIEQGKALGTVSPEVDTKAATTLFIGTIQGLIMQSLLSGDLLRIRSDAPEVFTIYTRGIRSR